MSETSQIHDEAWYVRLRRALGPWYRQHRRDLPWRNTRDPYRIWISEIMLQQTQVATVIDYYHRFLNRFPDVNALARADEQDVLTMWAGLGYYRRARQLHAAAQQICDEHAGQFPGEFQHILDLPGVGRYTAGAIASFAYDQRRPILEANTVRLYSRLMGLSEDPRSTAAERRLWQFAEETLPASSQVAEHNQALMELGSLICTPQQPKCLLCPVQKLCQAYVQGNQHEIPKVAKKAAPTPLTHALVVVRRRGRLLLRCNPAGQWWHGLWDFPRVNLDPPRPIRATQLKRQFTGSALQTRIDSAFHTELKLSVATQAWLRTMRHGVTRYRIELLCFSADLDGAFNLRNLPGEWRWVSCQKSPELPLTSTASKLFSWLQQSAEPAAAK